MIDYVVIPLSILLKWDGINEDILLEFFKKFSCSLETDLEDFLAQRAIPYERGAFGRTFLFFDKKKLESGEANILAFFTIAQTAIDLSALSGKKRRKMLGSFPGRDSLKSCSAYLIGQIGRCDTCVSQDLPGTVLLEECYSAIKEASLIVGGDLIILECREHMYDKFYKNKNFLKISETSNDKSLLTLYKKMNFNS